MTRRFVAAIEGFTTEEDKRLSNLFNERCAWWHWINGFWMIVDTSNTLDSPAIHDMICEVKGQPLPVAMVLEVSLIPDGLAGWAGSGPSTHNVNMFQWIEDIWVPGSSSENQKLLERPAVRKQAMKREMDLVRAILFVVEDSEEELTNATLLQALRSLSQGQAPFLRVPSEELLFHHIEIMQEAGLIEANLVRFAKGGGKFSGLRVTWEGHEFLDLALDSDVWLRVRDKANAMSFSLLKQVLSEEIKNRYFPA